MLNVMKSSSARKIKIILMVLSFLCLGWFLNQGVLANSAPETPPGLENLPQLEKRVFIHYKKGHVKPENPGAKKDKEATCYGFLAKGLKWTNTPIDLKLSNDMPMDAIIASFEEWDSHTGVELAGDYTIKADASWDNSSPDGDNELVFGNYSDANVIAVTVVWGYFGGPPQTRRITEFDILFDTDYSWGNADDNPNVMDLQNIATHELGHGLGLNDMYQTVCSEVTMYGYSTEGETIKRTLEPADIDGIQKLYNI